MEGNKKKSNSKAGLGGKVWRTLIFARSPFSPSNYLQAPQTQNQPTPFFIFFPEVGYYLII
jgi:hypothetical protein